MKLKNKLPILIAGGGISGLTLANCLKIAKIPFMVLEQAKSYNPLGGGIGLWGPALKTLNTLNLELDLKLKGKMMVSAGYRKSTQIDNGKWLVQPNNILDRHSSCLSLRRSYLQDCLLKNIEKDEIKLNSKVISFEEMKNGICVELDSNEKIMGSILIGADGINSEIRKKLFPEIIKEPCKYHYFQGIAHINDLSLIDIGYNKVNDNFPAYEAWHKGIRFGVVPLKHPQIFWFTAFDNDLSNESDRISFECDQSSKINKEFISKMCIPFGKYVSKIIHLTDPDMINYYKLNSINGMKTWTKGRITLMGDACHGMAPNLAQGAVLSMEDAIELAGELYKISNEQMTEDGKLINQFETENDIKKAFYNYETKRIKRCKVVQFLVPWVHTVGTMREFMGPLRDIVFTFSPKFIKSFIFDKTHKFALGWNFTPSNLGQGLYVRILGSDFMNNTVALKQFHSDDKNRKCSGSIRIIRFGFFGNIISSIFGLPKYLENGKVEVEMLTSKEGYEIWNRTIFNNNGEIVSKFNTIQSMFNENLFEKYGIFFFVFDKVLNKEKKQFDFVLKDFGLFISFLNLKIKFPRILSPIVKGTTIESDINICAGWNFKVTIDCVFGKLFMYEGTIDKIS